MNKYEISKHNYRHSLFVVHIDDFWFGKFLANWDFGIGNFWSLQF